MNRTLIIVCIIVICIAVVYSAYPSMNLNQVPSLFISVEEARQRRFGIIVDVRSMKEREELGFYPNSIPVSMEEIAEKGLSALCSPKTSVLVYSNGDDRAASAANLLYRKNYQNVRYLATSYDALMPGR